MTSDPLHMYMSSWAYNRNDDEHDNAKYAPDYMHPATNPCERKEVSAIFTWLKCIQVLT